MYELEPHDSPPLLCMVLSNVKIGWDVVSRYFSFMLFNTSVPFNCLRCRYVDMQIERLISLILEDV
jgi:hypothetical protein